MYDQGGSNSKAPPILQGRRREEGAEDKVEGEQCKNVGSNSHTEKHCLQGKGEK